MAKKVQLRVKDCLLRTGLATYRFRDEGNSRTLEPAPRGRRYYEVGGYSQMQGAKGQISLMIRRYSRARGGRQVGMNEDLDLGDHLHDVAIV